MVSNIFSSALREIGLDEYIIPEENPNDELELTQGCEMLAICEGIIGISPKYDSLVLIDECLGIEGENGECVFDFADLRKLFSESTIFVMDDSRFLLQYEEDFYRLCCYCICDCAYMVDQQIKQVIKKLVLLESSRSIAASIINGLKSPLKEYSFLQYYQCLEYLFRLNNSFALQDKFSIGVSQSIGIVTNYDFKLTEDENLRRVIIDNTVETDIDAYFATTGEKSDPGDSKEKKCKSVAQKIYKIRCQIAHLRYGQDTFLETLNWDNLILGITELILAIYQKCGTRIEATCNANNVWKTIDFSQNG